MEFFLNSNLKFWIDGKVSELPNLLEDKTEYWSKKEHNPISHPDAPITLSIGEKDIIGEIEAYEVGIDGKKEARYYFKDGKYYGLSGQNFQKAMQCAEKIWNRKEINEFVSLESIERIILNWINDHINNNNSTQVSEILEKYISEDIKEYDVLIPLEFIISKNDIKFADCIITAIDRNIFDELIGKTDFAPHRHEISPESTEYMKKHWLGRFVMKFTIRAKPDRASEIATNKAEQYMSLLQFFGPHLLKISMPSHVAIRGDHPHRSREALVVSNSTYISKSFQNTAPFILELDRHIDSKYARSCFNKLSEIANIPKSNFGKIILNALLIYGRAAFLHNPLDKLLQIITAIEMICLKDSSEPITYTVGDRIAFLISTSTEERQNISQNFREVYAIRSRKTHHGAEFNISEEKKVEFFMINSWKFFSNIILNYDVFPEKEDFIKYIDNIKYA